jgi:hypothetical protein
LINRALVLANIKDLGGKAAINGRQQKGKKTVEQELFHGAPVSKILIIKYGYDTDNGISPAIAPMSNGYFVFLL